jgi:hypothetical protein
MVTAATPTRTAEARVLQGVLVVQTYYVRRGDTPSYEIHVAIDGAVGARNTVLVTRSADIYTAALDAEGRDQRFDVTWKPSRTATGKACQVIVTFTPAALAAERTLFS